VRFEIIEFLGKRGWELFGCDEEKVESVPFQEGEPFRDVIRNLSSGEQASAILNEKLRRRDLSTT